MTFYDYCIFVLLRAQVISMDVMSLVGGCRIWFVLYCTSIGAL